MDKEKIANGLLRISEGFEILAKEFESEEKDVIRPAKIKGGGKKKEDPEESDDDLEIDLEDDGEAEEVEEDEEIEEDDESEAEESDEDERVDDEELPKLKQALNKYGKKHGTKAAVAILTKFAKTSPDVLKKDFAKLMKALKV